MGAEGGAAAPPACQTAFDDVGAFLIDGRPIDRPEVPVLPFGDRPDVHRGPGQDDLAAGVALDGEGREHVAGMALDDGLFRAHRLIPDLVGQNAGGLRT